jgi:hypothetical protein
MLFSKFKIEFEIFKKVFKKKKKNMSNKKNASKSPARAFLEHKRVACLAATSEVEGLERQSGQVHQPSIGELSASTEVEGVER